MSGEQIQLDIPPGIYRDGTEYSIGRRWFNGNQVRWYKNLLAPVGGWTKVYTFAGLTQKIRDMFSWRDYLKEPWLACGSADKLFSLKVLGPGSYTVRDITPAGLTWTTTPLVGFGAGAFGSFAFGMSPPTVAKDTTGQWSFDNFGRLLVGVHSQDGRLFSYDPATPAVIAAPVAGAPVDNTLVISTDEEFLMVLGGKNNPRRVKWCSQRNITDWTATETNSAGGFDLQSDGAIVAATRVQGGILVLTDTDVHMIEYIGYPNYYGRRRITEESSCIGKNCVTTYPQGAIWVGASSFWHYDGKVSRMSCDVNDEVFYNSNLTLPSRMSLHTNEHAEEVWLSYPDQQNIEPNRYALVSFGESKYWSLGDIPRTAWLNPVWDDKPLACNGFDLYMHEIGWTNNGATRSGSVFAETGAIELEDGSNVMRCDRIWPDFDNVVSPSGLLVPDDSAVTMSFKNRTAPHASETTYGPISLNSTKGYKNIRFRARQTRVRIDQAKDEFWVMGKVRLRAKEGGKR